MNKEQALQVIKQLHNLAIQKGLYANVESVTLVTNAITALEQAERNELKTV